MTKYLATDPNGKVHGYEGKREVFFVAFLKYDGINYCAHFAKTKEAAQRHWGADTATLARAIKA